MWIFEYNCCTISLDAVSLLLMDVISGCYFVWIFWKMPVRGSLWGGLQCREWVVAYYAFKLIQGFYSLCGRTSYRKISWSLEAARLCWNNRIGLNFDRHLDSFAAELPANFSAIGKVETRISRLRDFTRTYGKTPVRLMNMWIEGPLHSNHTHSSTSTMNTSICRCFHSMNVPATWVYPVFYAGLNESNIILIIGYYDLCINIAKYDMT